MEVSFADISHIKWFRLEDLPIPIITYEETLLSTDREFNMGIIRSSKKRWQNKQRINSQKRKKYESKNKISVNKSFKSLYFIKTYKHTSFNICNKSKIILPSTITLTYQEKQKFDIINLHSPIKRGFSSFFSNIMEKNTFKFYNFFNINKILPILREFVESNRKKEETEWNKIKRLYLKLFKIRSAIKNISHIWIYRKCLKNIMNTEDIATMEIPKKPVYVINFERRCSYVYEASTLRKAINNRLLCCDYMFVTPLYPLNILSNENFTYMQSVSIYNQMREYGACSWAFERFKVYGFNLKVFEAKCSQQLKLSAINNHFYNDKVLLFETVYDYFTLMADLINIEEKYIKAFRNDFINTVRYSQYIKSWIDITRRWYITQVTYDKDEIKNVNEESGILLAHIYNVYQGI